MRDIAPLAPLLVLLLCACGGGGGRDDASAPPATADPLVVPADELSGWQPASLADDTAAALRELIGVVRREYPGVDALAVAQRGRLVMDLTFRQATDRMDDAVGNLDLRLHAQLSVTKSLAAVLVGVAIDQGDLPADLATPYLPLLPHEHFQNPSAAKSAIRLSDVLSMRTGLAWNEWDPPYSSPDNQLNVMLRDADDFTQALFDLPMAATPGTVFAYATPATTSLGEAIGNAQPLALEDYVATYLLAPLDITEVAWLRTPTGLPDLGRGVLLRTRDLLKLGQLIVDGGQWRGRRVVPAAWLETMLEPRTELHWLQPVSHGWQLTGYAFQWWTGTLSQHGTSYASVAARGFGDQLLVVVPRLELVVALNSGRYDLPSREDALFGLVTERIVPIFAES